ncbi:hypothetical protein [uncultured Brevibacterium sp.]|uniref:hypothetical protein n=1 Tax=uncultured Brevibacterium sp. TaxID=189678 RepID=UPI0025CCF6CF|nr:hypothetical protein [uncultured Brevibacterium sp.]
MKELKMTLKPYVAGLILACLPLSACGAGSPGSSEKNLQTLESGPISVKVPESWIDVDADSVTDIWTAGKQNAENEQATSQVRLAKRVESPPYADAANQKLLMQNSIGDDGFASGGVEDVQVKGSDGAQLAKFTYTEPEGRTWKGRYVSAVNRESGIVATVEILTLEKGGMSDEEMQSIVKGIQYDKSAEQDSK